MVELLAPLAAIFIGAALFLIVAIRVGIPAVPVYIVVGLVLAPFIPQGTTLELAQWGIAFLVFTFGVDVEPGRFRAVARDSEHVAALQILLIGTLVFGLGLVVGLDALNAVYFASAAALSSSLVGRELAAHDIRRNLVQGRLISSIHFAQDLFAVVLILTLSADVFTPDGIALKLGYGVVILLVAVLVRVYLFDILVSLSGDSDELIILTGVALLLGFISLAELTGISIVIGAFAAGLAITQEFPNKLALEAGLESFDDFFAAIFFVTIGSLITIPTPRALLLAGVLSLVIVVLKPLVTIFALLYQGYETRTASLTSFGLDQVSEFALIIAIQALILERIQPDVFEAIILVAALTMITSTATRQFSEPLYRSLRRILPLESTHSKLNSRSSVDPSLQDHVIIVGYGRLGTLAARICNDEDQPIVVIDHDPVRHELATTHENHIFGDAVIEETWQRANADDARLILSTVPDSRVSTRILELEAKADVILRSDRIDEADELLEAGADYVIVPDFLASEQLLEKVQTVLTDDVSLEEWRSQNKHRLHEEFEFR
ncbi:cation:proton antiporter [Saliphagus infecundisoli]|uniref:Cation:proton antiporter n=1 Tax=Saliphagus infecundisoli TaxID=1849069 RepID=A0ABD5QHT9_9EURY|nr:cation:proton antiporter [Saliphagus infecundisoli]